MKEKIKQRGNLHKGHHIIPTSRGGNNQRWNIYRWQSNHSEKHRAWHTLFHDLTPDEVIVIIRHRWTRKDGSLNRKYFQARKDKTTGRSLKNKRLLAWGILFNDWPLQKAIEWIEKEFIRKEWLRP